MNLRGMAIFNYLRPPRVPSDTIHCLKEAWTFDHPKREMSRRTLALRSRRTSLRFLTVWSPIQTMRSLLRPASFERSLQTRTSILQKMINSSTCAIVLSSFPNLKPCMKTETAMFFPYWRRDTGSRSTRSTR